MINQLAAFRPNVLETALRKAKRQKALNSPSTALTFILHISLVNPPFALADMHNPSPSICLSNPSTNRAGTYETAAKANGPANVLGTDPENV